MRFKAYTSSKPHHGALWGSSAYEARCNNSGTVVRLQELVSPFLAESLSAGFAEFGSTPDCSIPTVPISHSDFSLDGMQRSFSYGLAAPKEHLVGLCAISRL